MTEKQEPNKPVSQQSENVDKQEKKPLSKWEAKRAQNLRDNLMRRKQQARSRTEQTDSE